MGFRDVYGVKKRFLWEEMARVFIQFFEARKAASGWRVLHIRRVIMSRRGEMARVFSVF